MKIQCILIVIFCSTGIFAQNPLGLHVVENHRVLFGEDTIGSGSKLLWLPDKASFRAGNISIFASSYWNIDSIGQASASFGLNNRSIGETSMTWGQANLARGKRATAFGFGNKAIEFYSTVWGVQNIATGSRSTTWGSSNNNSGYNGTTWGQENINRGGSPSTMWGFHNSNVITAHGSTTWGSYNNARESYATMWGNHNYAHARLATVFGRHNIANSYIELVMGQYADTASMFDSYTWDYSDPLFTIGNGSSEFDRSNALQVMKNGDTDINGTLEISDTLNFELPNTNGNLILIRGDQVQFGASKGFDFNSSVAQGSGVILENYNAESSGFYSDGDFATIWSPGDQSRLLRIYDEDGMVEKVYVNNNGDVYANGILLTSDARLKEKIRPLNNALGLIQALNPYRYRWNSSKYAAEIKAGKPLPDEAGEDQLGFIAQELAEILPELVHYDEATDIHSVDYIGLIPVLTQALKDQQEKINSLESRLSEIEALLN